jgi:hypothetical protein
MVEIIKNKDVPSIVRSLAHYKLRKLRDKVLESDTKDESQLSQYIHLDILIKRLDDDPRKVDLTPPLEPPMGAPI